MFLATNRQRSCLKVLQKETTSLCSDLKLQANFVWLSHLVNFSQVQVAAALGQFGTGAAFPQVSIVDLKQPQQQKKQNEYQNENKYVHFKKMVSDRIWRIDLYSSLVRYELCHLVSDRDLHMFPQIRATKDDFTARCFHVIHAVWCKFCQISWVNKLSAESVGNWPDMPFTLRIHRSTCCSMAICHANHATDNG